MEVDKAIEQLADIHEQLAKTQVFKEFKASTIAFSGLSALAGAIMQPLWIGAHNPRAFIKYWGAVAIINLVVFTVAVLYNSRHRTGVDSQVSRRIVMQFSPCLIAGALLSGAALYVSASLSAFLPGLWMILFSLGIFSTGPYLPKYLVWVGSYYMLAGATMLISLQLGANPFSPWGMGVGFALGQFAGAALFYFELEKPNG